MRARRQDRFTLIELLIVVGVIAVLAAMLLPALQRARETVNASVCVNNLRQISMGLFMYGDDAGSFPYITYQTGWGYNNDWQYEVAPYLGTPQSQLVPAFDWRGNAATAPDRHVKLYQCPKLARRWTAGPLWYEGKRACYGVPQGLFPRWNGAYFDPVVQYAGINPRMVIAFDNLNYAVWSRSHFNWDYFAAGAPPGNHGVDTEQFHGLPALNFAYADGHVQPHYDTREPGCPHRIITAFGTP